MLSAAATTRAWRPELMLSVASDEHRYVDEVARYAAPRTNDAEASVDSGSPPAAAAAPRRALVLAGGAAKGAFEVGALAELVERDITFDTIIGASAGALNAAYFAAGIRADREREAAREMVNFWIDEARWRTFLDISARDVYQGRGVSRSTQLERVLRERMAPLVELPKRRDVQLRLAAALLQPDAAAGEISYEHVFTFGASDLENRLGEVVHAAMASAAFPGLFAPVYVAGVGDCVDGGLVANTPLAEAATGHEGIAEIYILTPWSPTTAATARLEGLALVSRWIEILVSERFNREIAQAQRKHALSQALATERACGTLTGPQYRHLQRRLGVRHAARVVLIRPAQALAGDLLAAFGSRDLRSEYVAQGRAAAELALRQGAHR